MESLLQHMTKIWEKYEITTSDCVVLGISGGVDSMVLLDLIAKIHPIDKMIAAHIDHGIRTESKFDAQFVHKACEMYGISFELLQSNIQKIAQDEKTSLEAAGRLVRYGYFEKIRELTQSRFIITAHHRDDNIETVLINLIRGARLRGLSGIKERQGVLLRPLLDCTKSTIQTYASGMNIEYREDSTNEDSRYVRNRVRNEILPQMEQINPNVRDTLAHFATYAGQLDRMMEGLLGVYLSGNTIREEDFAKLPELLQFSLIEKIYASAHGGTIGLSTGNLEEIRRYILEARGGTTKALGKLRLQKRERTILWNQA